MEYCHKSVDNTLIVEYLKRVRLLGVKKLETQQTQQWLPVIPPKGEFYCYVNVLKRHVQSYNPVSIETGPYGLLYKKYFFYEGVVIVDNYNPVIKWVDLRLILNPDTRYPSFFKNGGRYLPFSEWQLANFNYHLIEVHQKNQ